MPEIHFWVIAQCLALVTVANGTPVVLKRVLGKRFAGPLDRGLVLQDGERLLGRSKTIRGVLLATLCSALAGPLIGLDWKVGAVIGAAAMAGDLLSSFIKRRLRLASSSMAPGVDQVPESALPLLAVSGSLQLTWPDILVGIGLFWVGELIVSRLLYAMGIRDRPY